ncbi:MAG TPA: hypothetical protein V6D12_04695 [Candidatus Obscuribacterales bacterium]
MRSPPAFSPIERSQRLKTNLFIDIKATIWYIKMAIAQPVVFSRGDRLFSVVAND